MIAAAAPLFASQGVRSSVPGGLVSRPEVPAAIPAGSLPLQSSEGERIGHREAVDGGVRLHARDLSVTAPRLQSWLASSDGRTLVGLGDPEALEHPFELQCLVLRDGERVFAPDERFGTESEVAIARAGRVALVGYRAGERGHPLALALAADGSVLFRHALAPGTMARDPLLCGETLLVRAHSLLGEGRDGEILALDARGARKLLAVPGALALVGFDERALALVLTASELVCFDVRDGTVPWRRTLDLRPASEHAWARWDTPAGEALAVVSAGLKRRDAPPPAARLLLLDALDGHALASAELAREGIPADLDLGVRGDELVLDWGATREVFTWLR